MKQKQGGVLQQSSQPRGDIGGRIIGVPAQDRCQASGVVIGKARLQIEPHAIDPIKMAVGDLHLNVLGVQAVQHIQVQIANGHFDWVNRVWLDLQSRFPDNDTTSLATVLSRYADNAAAYVAARLGTLLKNTALFLFHLSVTILAMFYLYRDGQSFMARIREVLPFDSLHSERMINEARDLIFASVVSSLVAAAAHGILGGIAFGLAGITAPVFWGVMMGFFSLVPLVGSALIWAPAAI